MKLLRMVLSNFDLRNFSGYKYFGNFAPVSHKTVKIYLGSPKTAFALRNYNFVYVLTLILA